MNVADFCKTMNISRTTFYYHYTSIWEIACDLKKRYMNSAEVFYQECSRKYQPFRFKNFLHDFLSFIQKNKDYYSLIKIAGMGKDFYFMNKFKEDFLNKMKDETLSDVQQKYLFKYNLSGFNVIIQEWIDSGFKESIDEIIEIIELCSSYNINEMY
jgi:AcrR family transcriptional regulator